LDVDLFKLSATYLIFYYPVSLCETAPYNIWNYSLRKNRTTFEIYVTFKIPQDIQMLTELPTYHYVAFDFEILNADWLTNPPP